MPLAGSDDDRTGRMFDAAWPTRKFRGRLVAAVRGQRRHGRAHLTRRAPPRTGQGRRPLGRPARPARRRAGDVLLRPRAAADLPGRRARRASFAGVRWQPASPRAWGGRVPDRPAGRRGRGARRACCGVPLVWPEPARRRSAPRCAPRRWPASWACGAAFVLAAGRLAFCGGFDLGDPEVLAEAAAAAGLPLEMPDGRGRHPTRRGIEHAGRRLLRRGRRRAARLRVGRRLFCGEARLPEARPPRGTARADVHHPSDAPTALERLRAAAPHEPPPRHRPAADRGWSPSRRDGRHVRDGPHRARPPLLNNGRQLHPLGKR